MRGRVFGIRGNALEVRSPGGVFRCHFSGKARRVRSGQAKLCAVGDEVEFADAGGGEGVIGRVLPRKSRLSRQDPASPRRELVIVANADALVVVVAARSPDLDLLTVDKCLVLGDSGGLPCAVAVNKMDLAPEGMAERLEPYRRAGFPVFLTSAVRGEGLDPLRGFVRGRMVALLGPSGAGKSSLVNALSPGRAERTGEVSARRGRGRHTTTWATVFEAAGGLIVDTPGLEYFTAWGVTAENVKDHFVEFPPLATRCRFRDCGHTNEPSCAVRKGAEEGGVAESRYANYLEIRRILAGRGRYFGG